jgi:hypothetical protein
MPLRGGKFLVFLDGTRCPIGAVGCLLARGSPSEAIVWMRESTERRAVSSQLASDLLVSFVNRLTEALEKTVLESSGGEHPGG